MKRILNIFIVLCIINTNLLVQAQISTPPLTVQSPNVASLGLFGEVPVSLFSGVPTIDVPLYEFQEHDINIPISLSYHASGFRPDVHPGWVGMGWALNCGGMISRTVKDMPDEYNNSNYQDGYEAGFWWENAVVNPSTGTDWNSTSYMQDIIASDHNYWDTEPDEFSFSFPGGSGKFYLDGTGHWKVQCDKPVQVTLNTNTKPNSGAPFLNVPFVMLPQTPLYKYGNFPSFYGFTITDEKGFQYIFGGDQTAIEYSIGLFPQDYPATGNPVANNGTWEWVAQSWYLTQVIDAHGNSVTLSYEKVTNTNNSFSLNIDKHVFIDEMYFAMTTVVSTSSTNGGSSSILVPNCGSTNYSGVLDDFCNGKLISPSYLSSIVGKNSNITFDITPSTELSYDETLYEYHFLHHSSFTGGSFLPYQNDQLSGSLSDYLTPLQWQELTDIIINDANNNPTKKIVLGYNNDPTQRLTLQTVTEYGSDGSSKPPYQFSYDQSVALPAYLANESDHWGFYNGTVPDISYYSSSDPNNPNNYYFTYYGYRQPNSTYLLAGTLNKIVYPTGGYTQFTFEPNYYSKRLNIDRTTGIDNNYNKNTLAGGLRIKQISSYDGITNVANTKNYYYVNGYSNANLPNISTLLSSGILGGQIQYYFPDFTAPVTSSMQLSYSQSLFSSQSLLPASSNTAGTHVGYTQVTEKLSDGSYTRHFFTNFDTDNGSHIDEPTTGLQLTQTPYEATTSLGAERGLPEREEYYNSSDVLLRSHAITYTALNKSNEYIKALFLTSVPACSGNPDPGPPAPGQYVAEGNAYKCYTYPYLPTSETTTQYDQNGNNPLVTTKNYSYDATNYRLMSSMSTQTSDGKTRTTKLFYPTDYTTVTNPSLFPYTSAPYTTMVSSNMIGTPIRTEHWITDVNGNNNTMLDAKSTNYIDCYGNNTIAGSSTATITNHIFAPNTIEEQKGSSPSEVRMRYQAYDNSGNVISVSKENDMRYSYIWDYNQTYPIAEIENANNTLFNNNTETYNIETNWDYAYTSFEADGTGNWTIPDLTPVVSTGGITGDNVYNLGAGLESHIISCQSLFVGNTYVVSCWSQGGDLIVGASGGTGATVTPSPTQPVLTKTINGTPWSLYSYQVAGATKVEISGNAIIDELRLYPANAQMTTYTYDPLVGMTSQCDANNKITYYGYDSFQRLQTITDQDGNIIKTYNYQY
jgi:YD repeat-containing protein